MTSRWLAGVAIFALGFGCAHMMKVTAANAADTPDEGVVDEGLRFVEHPDSFELIDTGIHRYLLLVKLKEGMQVAGPAIEAAKGSVTVSKEGLESVTIVKMIPLAELALMHPSQRECRPDFQDCVGPEPMLPPRPPRKAYELTPF